MCLYFQNLSLSGLSKLGALYVDERILFNSKKLENIVIPGYSSSLISFEETSLTRTPLLSPSGG